MKKRVLIVFFMLIAAVPAFASTENDNINVSTTVVSGCTITTVPSINFGNVAVNGGPVTNYPTIQMWCGIGVVATVTMYPTSTGSVTGAGYLAGTGGGATGTDHIPYTFSTPTASFTGAGIGSPYTISPTVILTPGPAAKPGTYADTIPIVVSF